MRILIGNDTDDTLIMKEDVRAWTQRVLWFAEEGDLIILSCDPDPVFLDVVTRHTNVDPRTLTFRMVPEGRFGGRMFDVVSLTDETFLAAIAADLDAVGRDDVDEIAALYPSAQVSRFAERLGLSDRLPGAAFFAQNGHEICNDKSTFRALAAAGGVPVSAGAVCRSIDEAIVATGHLLDRHEAVLVKKVHAGGGAGNQLLTRRSSINADHAGALYSRMLEPTVESIADYWTERWEWASGEGRFPVIIEQFQPDARSVYAEFRCTDDGVQLGEVGALLFEGGVLTQELCPLRDEREPEIDFVEPCRDDLIAHGTRLAGIYQSIGYRGRLSCDAVVTPDERVIFTEVNGRFSSSTHLYEVIAHRIAEVNRQPRRTVAQFTWPYPVVDLTFFLGQVAAAGLTYDPGSRKGILPAFPVIETPEGGQVLLVVISETDDERFDMLTALQTQFERALAAV